VPVAAKLGIQLTRNDALDGLGDDVEDELAVELDEQPASSAATQTPVMATNRARLDVTGRPPANMVR
jgi:hypothetical protein